MKQMLNINTIEIGKVAIKNIDKLLKNIKKYGYEDDQIAIEALKFLQKINSTEINIENCRFIKENKDEK